MDKISCIIPAYNEGPRIKNILAMVHTHPLLDEILVVDDGSTDNTRDIVREFPTVRLIALSENGGKSKAIREGVMQASHPVLFFLDADLLGLTEQNVTDLITPVMEGRADLTISVRKVSPTVDLFNKMVGMDFFSGERVFRKSILEEHLQEIGSLPRFGLETFINGLIVKHAYRLQIIFWENVTGPLKSKKFGALGGAKADFLMTMDILKTAPILSIVSDCITLRELQVDKTYFINHLLYKVARLRRLKVRLEQEK